LTVPLMGRVEAGWLSRVEFQIHPQNANSKPFGATLGLDCLAMVAYRSSSCAHHTGGPGASDDDHGVGAGAGRSLVDGAGTAAQRSCYMQHGRMARRQSSSPTAIRVRAHRQRLREQGLRPIQIWVPDVRSPQFAQQAHQQSLAVASSRHEADGQAFIDALAVDE
jgi:hypothetical protein